MRRVLFAVVAALVSAPIAANADTPTPTPTPTPVVQPDIVLSNADLHVDSSNFTADDSGCLTQAGGPQIITANGSFQSIIAAADLVGADGGVVFVNISGVASTAIVLCSASTLGIHQIGPTKVWLNGATINEGADNPTYTDDSTATLTIKASSRFAAVSKARKGSTVNVRASVDVYSPAATKWVDGKKRPVVLYRKSATGWTKVASRTSDAKGAVTFSVKSAKKHQYRLGYVGTGTVWPTNSKAFTL